MLSNIGNCLLIMAMLSSSLTIICGSRDTLSNVKLAMYFYLSSIALLISFVTLICGFLVSDFSIQNVFLNSSTLSPLIFKISGAWSSHEGSMLLWLCLLQLISIFYIILSKADNCNINILASLQLLFTSFIYFTSNPFNSFSFAPNQGLGLNPMLQDIALSIHPPILYLGYVSYAIPFTISCIMLINSCVEREALNLLKIFAGIGILFTTLGIALGSWWAYRELGWGGFWFFDPVENISLFPFLSGIALYHSALVSLKSGRMIKWTIVLSIITFLLVIFSTFLVRSGFIISIHSFAESPSRALYMLGIFTIVAFGSVGLLVVKKFPGDSSNTKITPIMLGNICFLAALVVLIGATLYPVIYSLFKETSVTINESFFINNFLIFTVPILLLMGFYVKRNSVRKHVIILLISGIISFIILRKLPYGFISAIIIILSIFLILHNIYFIYLRSEHFKKKLKASSMAMVLGHLGFGLLALAITLNALMQKEIDFIGKIGEKTQFENFKVTLQNIKFSEGRNYYRQIGEFWIEDTEHNITILKPENRFYIIEKTLSQESDIYSYLMYDLYAVLNKIDGEVIHAKIYYRPLMSFIWISVILIIGGFLVTLLCRKKLL